MHMEQLVGAGFHTWEYLVIPYKLFISKLSHKKEKKIRKSTSESWMNWHVQLQKSWVIYLRHDIMLSHQILENSIEKISKVAEPTLLPRLKYNGDNYRKSNGHQVAYYSSLAQFTLLYF